MNNLFLIENDNNELIFHEIEDILKKNQVKIDDLITFDMEEVNVSNAIMELDTYGFFQEKKIVWCKNSIFLTTKKSEIEHDIDALTKYINNLNPDNILIISCDKLDGKKNIVKLIKKEANIIDINFNYEKYIKKQLKGYQINAETINYLIECTGNINRLDNELNKLIFYKNDTKEITKKDIDLIVIKKVDDNIFDLIDAIISKNKKKSLRIYNEMINYGEEIFRIFVSLANQIRLIYQVKVLEKEDNEDIMKILKLKNPKQVTALRYKICKYRKEDLLDYLYKLAIMDEDLKLGKKIDKIVFPLFIASL